MKKNEHNPSFRGRIANRILKFILIAFILLFSAMIGVLVSQVRKTMTNFYKDYTIKVAMSNADEISRWVDIYLNDMRIYTMSDVVKTRDDKQIVEWLESHERLKNEDMEYVFYCGLDGIAHLENGSKYNIKNTGMYKTVFEAKAVTNVTAPSNSFVSNRPVFYVIRSIYDEEWNPIGFFGGAVSLDTLEDISNSISVGKTSYAFIIDRNGSLMAYPDRSQIMKQNLLKGNAETKKLAEYVYSEELGTTEYMNGKEHRQASFSSIVGTSWFLVVSMADSEVHGLANNLRNGMLLIITVIGILLLTITGLLISHAVRPLGKVNVAINTIASGDADLTKTIQVTTKDEIGLLVNGFNSFVGKLRTIVTNVKYSKEELEDAERNLQSSISETSSSISEILANIDSVGHQVNNQADSVDQTASAVTEIARNIESLEKMIQTQSAGVAEASSAVEEMIGNIKSVNSSVDMMAQQFTSLSGDAATGKTKQDAVNERVKDIKNQSAMLVEANSVISDIARQTNMLAMNASIEAAHAGEAGRGFSVVADEIRKLSETSTEQSKTIGAQIKSIMQAINAVSEASAESHESFNAVTDKIGQTDALVQQIKGAMEEQLEGSKQIFTALKDMNNSTSEVSVAASEMADGNKAILDEVHHLQDATGLIEDSMKQMSIGAEYINKTSATLSNLSEDVKDAVKTISGEIDKFKV